LKIILHIGHCKCGSTSLQEYLYSNNSKLLKYNIFPILDFGNKNQKHFAAYFNKNKNDFAKLNLPKNLSDDNFINLKYKIKNFFCNLNPNYTYVLSSEDLIRFDKKSISDLGIFLNKIGFEKIEIVFFIKRQDEMHYSWLNNNNSNNITFSKYKESFKFRSKYYNYLKIYYDWKNINPSKFHIFPIGKYSNSKTKSVVEIFHNDILNLKFSFIDKKANVSKNINIIQLLNHLNSCYELSIPYKKCENIKSDKIFLTTEDLYNYFNFFFIQNDKLSKELNCLPFFNDDKSMYFKSKNLMFRHIFYLGNKIIRNL